MEEEEEEEEEKSRGKTQLYKHANNEPCNVLLTIPR